MRNRIFITSIYTIDDITTTHLSLRTAVIDWSFHHRNILTFTPTLNALFINGEMYHSLDDVENHLNVKSVFHLTILQEANTQSEYDTNYIRLVQDKLKNEFDINSLMFHVPIGQGADNRIAYIDMNIGDRIQMFINYNGDLEWECEDPNIAVVDRNYIIHALSISSGQYASIHLKHNGETLYTIKVRVWLMGYNVSQLDENTEMINSMVNDGAEPNYNNILSRFESLATIRATIPESLIYDIEMDKEMTKENTMYEDRI